jgi:hypothetical protein
LRWPVVSLRRTLVLGPEERAFYDRIKKFVEDNLPHLTDNQRRVVTGKVYREMRRKFRYVRTEPDE